MTRLLAVCTILFSAVVCFAQQTPQPAPDPYKPVLDRLQSLTTVELAEWRFHDDVPHPEDPGMNDADWQVTRIHQTWETGPRVLRRWIEIPEKMNGYATQGARVQLELVFRSKDPVVITIF